MKAMFILATLLGFAAVVPQQKQEDFGLPELHKINTTTLGPSFSCQKDTQPGYGNTALFLSALSHRRNTPELLFNGACGSKDNFQSDDASVIVDLGEIPLERVTAQLIFNTRNVASFDAYSRFAHSVEVQPDHTYAVLLNSSEKRGMFVFTVTGYLPNRKLDLRYAVKQYQVLEMKAQSPGFGWRIQSGVVSGK